MKNFVDAFVYSKHIIIPLAVNNEQKVGNVRYTETILELKRSAPGVFVEVPIAEPSQEEFEEFFDVKRIQKMRAELYERRRAINSWLSLNDEEFIIAQTGKRRVMFFEEKMERICNNKIKDELNREVGGYKREDVLFLFDMAAKYANYNMELNCPYVSHRLRHILSSRAFCDGYTPYACYCPLNWGDALVEDVLGRKGGDIRANFIEKLIDIRKFVQGDVFWSWVDVMRSGNVVQFERYSRALEELVLRHVGASSRPKEITIDILEKATEKAVGYAASAIVGPYFGSALGVLAGDLIEKAWEIHEIFTDKRGSRTISNRLDGKLNDHSAGKLLAKFVCEAPYKINKAYFH